jgi:hypothetical protein
VHVIVVYIQNLQGIVHTCLVLDLPIIDKASDVEKVRTEAFEQFVKDSKLPKDQLRSNNIALIHQIYWV